MNQAEKATLFASLHQPKNPLVLFNAWDAGSAQAVADSGAQAIATGSWSVAAAHGYADGEALPLDLVIANARRITRAVELPVTLDFEGGYASDSAGLQTNITRVIESGAIGVNFEDQVVGGEGLYPLETQGERIRAVRAAAEAQGTPLFINARCDLFLKSEPSLHDDAMLEQATARARAYAQAGASGFFAPGLRDLEKIRALCAQSTLPVNILIYPDGPTAAELAACGVARISHGPFPYMQAMQALTEAARAALLN